jgi:hypothetical protein
MKKTTICLTALLVAATSLSMYGAPYRDLLTEDDYRKEQDDSRRPAVTAPDLDGVVAWKSFNRWECFSTERSKIECDQDEEGSAICYPHLIVERGSEVFDFQILTPRDYLNSKLIFDQWSSLLADEEAFCTYSAYLPDVSESHEFVFSIDRLKTAKGYWAYSAEENWREPDEDPDADLDNDAGNQP